MIYTCKAMIIYLTGTAAGSREGNLVILLCESDWRLSTQPPTARGPAPCPAPPRPALLHPCSPECARVRPAHTPTPSLFCFWVTGSISRNRSRSPDRRAVINSVPPAAFPVPGPHLASDCRISLEAPVTVPWCFLAFWGLDAHLVGAAVSL